VKGSSKSRSALLFLSGVFAMTMQKQIFLLIFVNYNDCKTYRKNGAKRFEEHGI
jgi:hypothetical protein